MAVGRCPLHPAVATMARLSADRRAEVRIPVARCPAHLAASILVEDIAVGLPVVAGRAAVAPAAVRVAARPAGDIRRPDTAATAKLN